MTCFRGLFSNFLNQCDFTQVRQKPGRVWVNWIEEDSILQKSLWKTEIYNYHCKILFYIFLWRSNKLDITRGSLGYLFSVLLFIPIGNQTTIQWRFQYRDHCSSMLNSVKIPATGRGRAWTGQSIWIRTGQRDHYTKNDFVFKRLSGVVHIH